MTTRGFENALPVSNESHDFTRGTRTKEGTATGALQQCDSEEAKSAVEATSHYEHIMKSLLLMPRGRSMEENSAKMEKRKSQPRTGPPRLHQPQPHHRQADHRHLLPVEADWLKLSKQPRQNNQMMRTIRGMKAMGHGSPGRDDGLMEKQKEQRGRHHRPGEAGVQTANHATDMHNETQVITRNAQTIGQTLTSGGSRACSVHRGLATSGSLCENYTHDGGTLVP